MQSISNFLNIRLLITLGFWSLCVAFHHFRSRSVYKLGMEMNLQNHKPLYDILQYELPNLQNLRFIPELLHVIPVISLVGFIAHYRNTAAVDALREFLYNHGILLTIRAICFSVTLLPDSSQMCTVSTHIGSCFDLIFSGHSTVMYLCTYIINSNFYISRTVYTLLHLNNLITCFLIVTCRNHYTIDVIISVLFTYLIYYHNKI